MPKTTEFAIFSSIIPETNCLFFKWNNLTWFNKNCKDNLQDISERKKEGV